MKHIWIIYIYGSYMDHMVETKDLNPNAWGCTIFYSLTLCGFYHRLMWTPMVSVRLLQRQVAENDRNLLEVCLWCVCFWIIIGLQYLFLCIQYLNLFLVDSFKRRIWLYFNHEIIALQWYPSGEEYEHIAGWWFQTFFIFHFIYGIIILPIDFHILKDGYCTTNQSLFFSIFVRFFSWPFAKPWGEAALYGLPSMLNHSAFVAGRGWWFPWTAPRKGGSRETWNLFGLRIGIPMICCKW